ncbi:MAG: hypothetical protein ISR62_05275 [Desulfobacteraceae bacterium]|nr:hypothetical protein [Desulfobacteraceae bacterium]MBL7173207.1 hypothetical protein [Desulfobacteraceae bacterium]
MAETHQVDLEPQRFDQFEDEIELMDYLKVIWKWKYLILIGTLVCVIGAAVVSLNMTKIYGISTVVQPGMLKVTEDGKTVYIDSPQNIKGVIETGGFNGEVLKNIKFPNKQDAPTSVKVKVTIPKDTNALEVLYETPHVDIGLQIMHNLNKHLLKRYGVLVKSYQENYDNEMRQRSKDVFILNDKISKARHAISGAEADTAAAIEQLNNNKSTLEAQIDAKKKQIKNLEQRISEVEIEIGRISKNTDFLIAERNKFLGSKETERNILSAVIYSNTIQQNISYLNDLRATINSTKSQIYEARLAVESLTNQIKDLMAKRDNINEQTRLKKESLGSGIIAMENERNAVLGDIESLKFKKDHIQNVQIIKPPMSSLSPIKPKTRLNVMLAGVVGLFLTVFLAFFVEYISKYKSREDER